MVDAFEALAEAVRTHRLGDLNDTRFLTLFVRLTQTALEQIPPHLLTLELCEVAVSVFPSALKFIPDQYRTANIIKLAVEADGDTIQYLPANQRKEYALMAIKSNPFAIQHIDNPSYELQKVAVSKNGMSLKFMRDIKPMIARLAISTTPESFVYAGQCLTPEDYITPLRVDGMLLRFIPKKLITKEMTLAAVEQNGLALQYLVPDMCPLEVCNKAIESDPRAIQWVVNTTKQQQLMAVKTDGLLIRFINCPDSDVKREAVMQNPRAVQYLDDEYYSLLAVALDGMTLQLVKTQTRPVCLCAIARNPDARVHVKIPLDQAPATASDSTSY